MAMNKRFWLAAGLVFAVTRLEAATCGAFVYNDQQNNNLYLRVTGTAGKQTVVIDITATTTTLSLDCNGDGDFVDAGEINAVDQGTVQGLDLQVGGSDVISVNLTGSLTSLDPKIVKVLLGGGTNVLNMGSGPVSLGLNARYLVDIVGGVGIDKPTLDFSSMTGDSGALQIRADLGAGNDTMVVKAPGLGGGGFLSVDAALGLGTNSFTYTDGFGATDSTARIDVQGDAGVDMVTMNFAHASDARLLLTADLGAGNDKFFGNFDLANTSVPVNQPLHLTVNGGLGNDTITVGRNGTTGPAVAGNMVELDLNGGAGNDIITVDFGGGGFQFSALGGERLRIDGGNGVDLINVILDSITATAARHDISISGGALADRINFTQNTSGAGTHSWFGGAALIDGSFGSTDTCTVAGSAAANAHKRNCEL
jgi:hypothetical protein